MPCSPSVGVHACVHACVRACVRASACVRARHADFTTASFAAA